MLTDLSIRVHRFCSLVKFQFKEERQMYQYLSLGKYWVSFYWLSGKLLVKTFYRNENCIINKNAHSTEFLVRRNIALWAIYWFLCFYLILHNYHQVKSLKDTWMKKYLDPENRSKWKNIFNLELGKYGGNVFFKGNLNWRSAY